MIIKKYRVILIIKYNKNKSKIKLKAICLPCNIVNANLVPASLNTAYPHAVLSETEINVIHVQHLNVIVFWF